MGNNEPAVDQSDLRICGSYGLILYIYIYRDSESVESTRWGSLTLAPIIHKLRNIEIPGEKEMCV